MTPTRPERYHSIRKAIHQEYQDFTPGERSLADLILNFPGELIGYSASELARMAKTSNATVSRFVRRLGFENFDEMRRLAREEHELGAPLFLRSGANSSLADAVNAHLANVTRNLQETIGRLDLPKLQSLVEALATAPRVWVIGFRHSYYLAGYLRWSLVHARAQVHLIPAAGETLGESLVDVAPGDVCIGVVMRRRVANTIEILQVAQSKGARIAVITDPGMTGTETFDWDLRCQSRTPGPIDDHAPALALIHIIVERVLAKSGTASRTRLGDIDDLHTGLGEL